MHELIEALAHDGYSVDDVTPDGKIHRFQIDSQDQKKSGFYIAYQNFSSRSGEAFYVIVYGDWRGNEPKTYCSLKGALSPEDKKLIKKKLDEASKREQAHRKQENEATAIEVQKKWDSLSPIGQSDYLRKKQIADCPDLGIRYEQEGGSFYVPLKDEEGKLWSLQKIQYDGSKFFYPGGRVNGCFHVFGVLENGVRIFLAEGFATGATISLATSEPTVSAFTAGNLGAVARALKAKFPDASIVVCGDDDKWKDPEKNPGREKAELAATQCLGKSAFPVFSEESCVGKTPTDWNDLHVLEGIEAVREQIAPIVVTRQFVAALGFKEKEYFFTSSNNRQIVAVTRFVQSDFLNLMPIDYWEACFPGGQQQRVDWVASSSDLMQQCRAKGIFQSRHIRGAGVWNDEGRIVVNMGDHLIVDGDRVELGDIKSRFFYTLGSSLSSLHPSPLSSSECDTFVRACSTFKWVKDDFGFLMAGSLVISRICGALPIRPHTWITGGSHTGKTTLLERLIQPLIGESVLYVQAGTTEAGIRQSLRADAIPVVFDEFETTGQKSAEKIADTVELLRAAWSDSSAYIVKGSSGGNANAYQVRFSAIVSSIRVNLTNDADRSRFAVIELAPHGSDLIHWKELSELLEKIDYEYGERLFARTVKMIPVLLANFKRLKSTLAKKASQRFGDQYGMLLAGYSVLLQDGPLTDSECEMLVSQVILAEEKAEALVADQNDVLEHLLTKNLTIEKIGDRYDFSIGGAIKAAKTDSYIDEALQRIGIKVRSENVCIACKNSALEEKAFKGTRWSMKWSNSLSRLPGALKNQSVWLDGRNVKCTLLPNSVLGFNA